MGLSASQARFLQLTARRNDVEYQAQQVSQERLSLAQQLTQISNEYNDSISNKKLMFTYADSTVHQIEVSYSNYKNYMNQQMSGLTSSQQQIFLVSTSGKIVVTNHEEMQKIIEDNTTYTKVSDVNAAKSAEEPTDAQKEMNDFDWSGCNVVTKDDGEEYYVKSQKFGLDDFVIVAKDSAGVEQKLRESGKYSDAEVQQILNSYVYGSDLNDVELFQQSIKEGIYSFATFGNDEDTKDKLIAQDWSTIANGALSEKLNEADDSAAKAKYDTESKRLEFYDKKLQMEMDELESEREAINTEMDSIKKVVDDNIQKSFDTFS